VENKTKFDRIDTQNPLKCTVLMSEIQNFSALFHTLAHLSGRQYLGAQLPEIFCVQPRHQVVGASGLPPPKPNPDHPEKLRKSFCKVALNSRRAVERYNTMYNKSTPVSRNILTPRNKLTPNPNPNRMTGGQTISTGGQNISK